MIETEAETVDIHPITFPPQVLARISPELSLQRHLSLGIRPCLRAFEEFRDININEATLSRYSASDASSNDTNNNILGSNVLKCGNTFVITSITGGIVEENIPVDEEDYGEEELLKMSRKRDEISKYVSVFPLVEVERGRVGAPTDEEMTISQKLYDCVLHSGIIPKSALQVKCGVRTTDHEGNIHVAYPDEVEDLSSFVQFLPKRRWSYVLYAKIVVFSRTGPVFDLCWNSLIYALKNTKLPRAFIDERATALKTTVRTRGRSATIREAYDILCDTEKSIPLQLLQSDIGFASSYGIIDLDPEAQIPKDDVDDVDMEDNEPSSVLLADLDTETEESCIFSTISIIGDSKGNLNNVTLLGGGAKITPEMVKRSIVLSKERSNDLESKN